MGIMKAIAIVYPVALKRRFIDAGFDADSAGIIANYTYCSNCALLGESACYWIASHRLIWRFDSRF